ncbi:hypothetical protein [Amycolatopsis sp. CA-128772]|uniref:hypothetical protein n=1 Tax=Amycolatopsis sp. CA-128772 TaxID=2073159 RepID=UPI001E550A28|nr:hypothetical protein [Amycolatopsis sp. CA-128772]
MTSTPDTVTPEPDAVGEGDPAETVLLLRRLVERNGTWALTTVVAALTVWLGVHLARAVLVLVVRILTGAMARLDRWITARVLTPPTGRVNHYFDGHNATDYDPYHHDHDHRTCPGPVPGRAWEAAHA